MGSGVLEIRGSHFDSSAHGEENRGFILQPFKIFGLKQCENALRTSSCPRLIHQAPRNPLSFIPMTASSKLHLARFRQRQPSFKRSFRPTSPSPPDGTPFIASMARFTPLTCIAACRILPFTSQAVMGPESPCASWNISEDRTGRFHSVFWNTRSAIGINGVAITPILANSRPSSLCSYLNPFNHGALPANSLTSLMCHPQPVSCGNLISLISDITSLT